MNINQSNSRHYRISEQERDSLPNLRLLRRFEGGSVSLAEGNAKFQVITNEGTMADFLDEEDQALAGINVTEFDTEEDRAAYLEQRGWVTTPLCPDGVDSLRRVHKTARTDTDAL